MKHAVIPFSWTGLSAIHRFDAKYWITVSEEVVAAGIDPMKATSEEVRAAMKRVQDKADAAEAEIHANREKINELEERSKSLRENFDRFPAIPAKDRIKD